MKQQLRSSICFEAILMKYYNEKYRTIQEHRTSSHTELVRYQGENRDFNDIRNNTELLCFIVFVTTPFKP